MFTQESKRMHNIMGEKQFIQYIHIHMKQRHKI